MVWISKTMLKRSSRGQQAVGTNYSWMKKKPVGFQSAALSSRQIWDPLWCYPLPGGKKNKNSNRCWESCSHSSIFSLPAPLTYSNICEGILCYKNTKILVKIHIFFFPPSWRGVIESLISWEEMESQGLEWNVIPSFTEQAAYFSCWQRRRK